MSGITEHGIRYPDSASRANQLGPELKRMADDLDTYIWDHAGPVARGIVEDLLSEDATIRAAAVAAMQDAAVQEKLAYFTPQGLGSSVDLDTLPSGRYTIWAASIATALGMPVAWGGVLEVAYYGTTGGLQTYWVSRTIPEIWTRVRSGSGWHEWVRVDAGAVPAPELPELPELPQITGASGWRVVPLSITLPGSQVTQDQAEGAARWVRRFAHRPQRVRLHVSNRHPGLDIDGPSATLVGAMIGIGQPDGSISQERAAMPPNSTIPADGSELVGPWIDCPGDDGDLIGISLAWSGGTSQHIMQGGGWTRPQVDGWDQNTRDVQWNAVRTTPFYVWLEAEVPARVPIVVVNGDSISIGTGTTVPVSDAWPAIYALAENALPVFYSQHASAMYHWTTDDHRWTELYPGTDKHADAIIMALGQNDLSSSATVATLQERYRAVRNAHRTHFPGAPAYIANLTPSDKLPAVEAVRRTYNSWLATLPEGERGVFNFAAAIGDPTDEFMQPDYSADGLHPNTAGQVLLASVIEAAQVTPYCLPTSKLRTL